MSRDVRGACALYYSYQVRGADGRIKVPFRRRTAHSFLIVYLRALAMHMAGLADIASTDTGGTSRAMDKNTNLLINASSGTSTYGNVVGTGSTAVAFTDTKLVTQIAHGTSAGQLSYGACVVNLPSSDSTSTTLIITRPFSNASGGSITITEIGIYAQMKYGGGSDSQFCIVRDLATIALINGDLLTLNYILKTTA